MKNKRKTELDDDLQPQYDLRDLLEDGVRGKYAERYHKGTNLIPLDPDVAEVFGHDEATVNEALRKVIELSKLGVGKAKS